MRREESGRAQWLLIKHRDEHADPGYDVVGDVQTSVTTGRTMEEIASGKRRVWNSNRSAATRAPTAARKKARSSA
jgi:bifunctional non-homologous end joining protein LigD